MSHDVRHPPLLSGEEPEATPLGARAHWKEPSEREHVWDKKRNVEGLLRLLYAVCVVLVVLDLVVHRHTEHPWEHLVGFYPLYGFIGITILVIAARGLRALVMRPEDYYDDR